MIEIKREDGDITDVRFSGQRLEWNDPGWVLPKGLIGETAVNDLPEDEAFEICTSHEDGVIMIDTVPIQIQRIGDRRVRIEFNDSGTRKYWDGKVGFSTYMEAKKAIIQERAAEIHDLTLETDGDDGAGHHFTHSAAMQVNNRVSAV